MSKLHPSATNDTEIARVNEPFHFFLQFMETQIFADLISESVFETPSSRDQSYKTFHGCKLQVLAIS
jgi:hypothetical protein